MKIRSDFGIQFNRRMFKPLENWKIIRGYINKNNFIKLEPSESEFFNLKGNRGRLKWYIKIHW